MAFVYDNKIVGTRNGEVLEANYLSSSPDRDFIIGRGGNDVIRAGNGDDYVLGGRGADDISGNRGHDILRGGKGDDSLKGGIGDDILAGDWGADILKGDNNSGGGADTFWFEARTAGFANKKGALASDTIVDFEAGLDELLFTGFDPDSSRIYTQQGSDVLVSLDVDGDSLGDYDLVTVENALVADVLAASLDGGSPLP